MVVPSCVIAQTIAGHILATPVIFIRRWERLHDYGFCFADVTVFLQMAKIYRTLDGPLKFLLDKAFEEQVKNEKHKHSKLKGERRRVRTPEGSAEITESYEYVDDFEYEDEFEDEEGVDENSKFTHGNTDETSRNGILTVVPSLEQVHLDTEKPQAYLSSRRLSKNSTGVAEPVVEDTPLIRRLASRQGGRALTQSPQVKPVASEKKVLRIASATSRIDFTSTSDVNHSAVAEADERYRKLNSLIMIEHVTYTIVDQPPMKDYDFYMELFGKSGRSLLSTQTGDDNLSEETQTEETTNAIKWTQHPPRVRGFNLLTFFTFFAICGGNRRYTEMNGYGWGTESGVHVDANSQEDMNTAIFRENHLQNSRLKRFLETASQVVIDLISARRRLSMEIEMSNKSVYPFSSGFNTFELGPLAQSSRVTTITFNPKEPDLVLVGFFVEESLAEDIVNRTLLVEYFMENDRPPKRLFSSEGEVTSTCYTNDNTTLIAGVSDGVVEVYDLLEPSSTFSSSLPWIDSPGNIPLRSPAYDSSFLSSTLSDGKAHPIIDVQVMENEIESSCQVASLDQSGTISLWIVLRNSQGQPGVRPQSHLSLQLLALIRPDPFVMRSSSQPTPLLATCMVTRSHPPLFLVGFRGVHGEVLCARMSPFEASLILVSFSERKCYVDMLEVGLSTGSLLVYSTGHVNPIVLTPPASSQKPAISVEWSPISSTVLYSLHGHTRLLVWDLSKGLVPQGVHDLWQQALGLSSGTVEIHALEATRAKHDDSLLAVLNVLSDRR
uniref:WD_REPEATS_REGION domain-containing protein n=1 Tax=Angiostrongylus cantonensis TaxID=6313 RepID=A0A158P8S1_ANGCA